MPQEKTSSQTHLTERDDAVQILADDIMDHIIGGTGTMPAEQLAQILLGNFDGSASG